MRITNHKRVPLCRSCGTGHWTDYVDRDSFCYDCGEGRIQKRPEGYYWIKVEDDQMIDYYGPTFGTDQFDQSTRIITDWSWYEVECNEDELVVISGPLRPWGLKALWLSIVDCIKIW
jgi:hypothetical protein